MFFWRERIEPEGRLHGVEWAFTDRLGGASQAPWGELNLGAHVGDLAEAVDTNRHRLARELGLRLADLRFMDQQHGCTVAVTAGSRPGTHSHEATAPQADGLVSACTDEALVVLVADCTPVLLVDREVGLVAAVHAGRPGMMAGVVPETLATLRDLGAGSIEAVVGPSVCPRCYEVPAELRAAAADVTPVAASVTRQGTPAIDVAGAVVDQLRQHGIPLRWLSGCTREREDLFSFRRDGTTGRFAGVVRLLPAERAA